MEIHKNGFFPWIKSYQSVIRLVREDFNNTNNLKTFLRGSDKGKTSYRYYIKGENLINYLENLYENKIDPS